MPQSDDPHELRSQVQPLVLLCLAHCVCALSSLLSLNQSFVFSVSLSSVGSLSSLSHSLFRALPQLLKLKAKMKEYASNAQAACYEVKAMCALVCVDTDRQMNRYAIAYLLSLHEAPSNAHEPDGVATRRGDRVPGTALGFLPLAVAALENAFDDRGARRRSALARSCRALTGSGQSGRAAAKGL